MFPNGRTRSFAIVPSAGARKAAGDGRSAARTADTDPSTPGGHRCETRPVRRRAVRFRCRRRIRAAGCRESSAGPGCRSRRHPARPRRRARSGGAARARQAAQCPATAPCTPWLRCASVRDRARGARNTAPGRRCLPRSGWPATRRGPRRGSAGSGRGLAVAAPSAAHGARHWSRTVNLRQAVAKACADASDRIRNPGPVARCARSTTPETSRCGRAPTRAGSVRARRARPDRGLPGPRHRSGQGCAGGCVAGHRPGTSAPVAARLRRAAPCRVSFGYSR